LISKNIAKAILGLLLKNGGDFGEIFIQSRKSNGIRFDDNKLESASSGFEEGCGIRLIHNDCTYYAYVDSIQKLRLIETAKVLSSAINNSSAAKVLNLNATKSNYFTKVLKYPDKIDTSIKSNILFEINNAAREVSSKVIQVTSTLNDIEEDIIVINSEGLFSESKTVRTFLAVNVVAMRGKEIKTGYKSYAKTKGFEIFDEKNPIDIAKEAASIAVKMLDAINAPAGSYPVVIGPGFGGVIFHEACGHGLEADAIVKDASVFKDKIGKKIASEVVTAVDDSTLEHHWGSYKFDGEGYPSRKNILIEKGILKSYLSDYKSAKKLGIPITGNGRRQSYRDIPFPRMSNTFIDNGDEDPIQIIKSVKKGIYAKEFLGGQVDPATGDFVFGISEGYLIENGSITNPIKGATLIGNGPEVLKKIVAVGGDLDFSPGFCGKNGQSIPNEVGQPTILVSDITVGGTSI